MELEELDKTYAFALELAKTTGQILLEGIHERCRKNGEKWQRKEHKTNAVDIVTQMDNGALVTLGLLSRTVTFEVIPCVLFPCLPG